MTAAADLAHASSAMCDPAQLDASQTARLARGELLIEAVPVSGSAVAELHVWAVIEAPAARVWAIIDRPGEFSRTMQGVKASAELSRTPIDPPSADAGPGAQQERVRARVTVGMPFPLRDLTSITDAAHTVRPDGWCQRRWEFVEGDYHENRGSWTVMPFAGDPQRTLAHYKLHAEPKIRVPGKLKEIATERAAPRLFAKLRKLCAAR